MTGKTIVGVVFLVAGLGMIIGNEVRGHPWDHWVLGSAVGLMVFGAHLISNTAVKSALVDLGDGVRRLWPFGQKSSDQSPPDGV